MQQYIYLFNKKGLFSDFFCVENFPLIKRFNVSFVEKTMTLLIFITLFASLNVISAIVSLIYHLHLNNNNSLKRFFCGFVWLIKILFLRF